MSGRITTHALDLSSGKPAAGMRVELWAMGLKAAGGHDASALMNSGGAALLADIRLNEDGRCSTPLLEGELTAGVYELRFHVRSYYGDEATVFLDLVPVRFVAGEPDSHYHVPLLLSPGGYSTYRGS
ncbi:MAG: Transthyretin family protein [Paenibacillaceae bacterium]|jgi:5-hydroxyisourate hydrolase|nr:Transthyretin family protein [Paenibacillaceae bacterium]